MFRNASSKVIWVGRATVFMVGLAVILAVVLGVATTALGATGSNFILGKANKASAMSSLVTTITDPRKVARAALMVQQKSGGPALDLKVGNATAPANDVAPMKVNSNHVVTNLNADLLDGKSDTDFYAAGSQVDDSVHADSATNADNADTVDGKHAAEFYAQGSKVDDSDKLDSMDSSDFASAALFGSASAPRISGSGPDCILGEVRLFASIAPVNWLPADGKEMMISQNQTLFTILGTTYGGDGKTTFALPDLRGAEPKGAGPAAPFYAICVTGVFP